MQTPQDNHEQSDGTGSPTPGVPAEFVPREAASAPFADAEISAVRRSHPPVAPTELSQAFPSMTMLLRGLRRCWAKAFVVGVLLAAGLGVAAWFLLPAPKVRVRTMLQMTANRPHVLFPDRGEARHDFSEYKKTQAALAKTRAVLQAALRDPKIAGLAIVEEQADPVEWLERELVVDYSAGPELMTITLVTDKDADAILLVNALASAYLSEIVVEEYNWKAARRKALTKVQNDYKTQLTAKRDALTALVDAAGTSNLDVMARKQKLALEELDRAQKELIAVKSDVRRLKLDISSDEEAKSEATIPDGLVNEAMEQDPKIRDYVREIELLQQQIQETQQNNPKNWKQVTHAQQAKIETITKAVEERKKKLRPQIEEQIAKKQQNLLSIQSTSRKNHLARLKKLEEDLQKEVDNFNLQHKANGRMALDLESLREEIDQVDEVLKKINHQVEVMKVEDEAEPRIRVAEPAIAIRPDPRKRQAIAAGVTGLGTLFLVLLGFAWWECRHFRVDTVDQVRLSLGVPVMGTLPLVPTQTQQSRFGFSFNGPVDWEYCLLESVDLLRTVLLHAAKTESLRVVMVTSALGGEGKTSLSSQLATSLARAGRKVLLIDGDLRKPCLHRVFDLNDWHGLCEALRGEILPGDAIQATAVDGLSVLPAGDCDEAALQALAHRGVVEILSAVRSQFDFILVDSAPVLPVADSLLMAQAVDGVLLALMRDVSRMAPVYAAQVRLAALNVRMLGAVLAGTHPLELYEHKYRYAGRVKRALEPATETESAPEEEAS